MALFEESLADVVAPAASSCAPQLLIEVVGDLAGMHALADEWRGLEARVTDSFTYFQSYDWCARWAEAFAGGKDGGRFRLHVLCIRRGRQLVSLWPLVVSRHRFGLRLLRFMGEPLSQYGNILIDRTRLSIGEARRCWEEALAELKFDAMVLDRMPLNGALAQILRPEKLYRETGHVSSMVNLRRLGSWESYQASLGRPARKSRNRRRRQLENLGRLEFRVFSGGTDDFREIVNATLAFKMEWLEATGRPVSNLSDSRTAPFLASLCGDAAVPQGAIASSMLLDDRPIATEIGFCRRDHYYSFLGAFDWAWRDYSPGKVHLEASLKWAFEAGLSTFDLLGNPSAYKEHWSNANADLAGYGAARTPTGAVYAHLWRPNLRPFAKQAFERLPASLKRQVLGVLPTA